jgi:hypothetical protein
MIRTKEIEERFRRQRLDAKSLDNLFRRRIEAGAHCAPVVSAAILQIVKEVFPFPPDNRDLDHGRLKLLVVAAGEPAGKPLDECQKVSVTLTLDAGRDDQEVRQRYGIAGLRRARLLRLAAEARDQGGLLSYEDLAYRLLNCAVRTIIRDAGALRRLDLEVPTRGQQQDIGPGQCHRVQAVRLYLSGLEANEIADRLYHTLGSIENYIVTFARVVFLASKGYDDDAIAFVIRRSSTLVAAYRRLHEEAEGQCTAQARIREILQNGRKNGKKRGGRP